MSYKGNEFYEERFRQSAKAGWEKRRAEVEGLPGEEWKPCPSWPGYWASTAGRIRSQHKVLKPHKATKFGHLNVSPSVEGVQAPAAVHRMVLDAFVGPPPEKHEARHLNGDPGDNRPENLAWGTREENQRDRQRHGTTNAGAKNGRAKISEETAAYVWRLHTHNTPAPTIAHLTGLTLSAVRMITGGFRWNSVTGLPTKKR